MKKLSYFLLGIGALSFVACGGNTEPTPTPTGQDSTTVETPAEPTEPAASAASNTITIEGNDEMKYNTTEFTVKAGEEVSLTIKNVGKLPAEAMSHDVVILKPGTDVKDFGLKTVQAGGIEKISADMKAQIVAFTKMVGPGAEDTVKFTLPEAGAYPFFCSFPGHYASMNGTITAQ